MGQLVYRYIAVNLTNASLFTLLPPLANIVVASFVVGLCTLHSFDPYPITYSLSNP
jgi:hypothetical protein